MQEEAKVGVRKTGTGWKETQVIFKGTIFDGVIFKEN